MKIMKIQTAFGEKTVSKRVGEYYYSLPAPNAPNGAWWTLNPQHGFVPVPSTSRALQEALRVAGMSEALSLGCSS